MRKRNDVPKEKCDCDVNELIKEQEREGWGYSNWYDKGGYVFCNTHRVNVSFVWEEKEVLKDGA